MEKKIVESYFKTDQVSINESRFYKLIANNFFKLIVRKIEIKQRLVLFQRFCNLLHLIFWLSLIRQVIVRQVQISNRFIYFYQICKCKCRLIGKKIPLKLESFKRFIALKKFGYLFAKNVSYLLSVHYKTFKGYVGNSFDGFDHALLEQIYLPRVDLNSSHGVLGRRGVVLEMFEHEGHLALQLLQLSRRLLLLLLLFLLLVSQQLLSLLVLSLLSLLFLLFLVLSSLPLLLSLVLLLFFFFSLSHDSFCSSVVGQDFINFEFSKHFVVLHRHSKLFLI